MGTYSLHAADLLTLLASTVTPGTESEVLQTLITNGLFPLVNSDVTKVETHLGPPGAVPGVNDFNVTPGEKIELITLPTSTADPAKSYPKPTAAPMSAPTVFNFTNTTSGVVFVAGDQNVFIKDFGVGGDTLIGGVGYETLQTFTGANVLMAGKDINGGNTLLGGTGADTLIGGGHSSLVAGSGDQVLMGGTIAGAHDTLIGGSGVDLLTVKQGANSLVAGSGANTLRGGSGSDTLLGGGHSSLVAGTGNQHLYGVQNGGTDTLIGGSGADYLQVFFGANSLVGGSGQNTLTAGAGSDTLVGGGHSKLIALGGETKLISSSTNGSDTLVGGSGHDTMIAVSGNNSLIGGQGNDTVTLGSGGDTLVTSAANDLVITGGTGVFTITDKFAGNTTISGGSGGGVVALGAYSSPTNAYESILGGSGAINITSDENLADLKSNSSTAVGGLHTLTFNDGQTIVINDINHNVTIHFAGGGTTAV